MRRVRTRLRFLTERPESRSLPPWQGWHGRCLLGFSDDPRKYCRVRLTADDFAFIVRVLSQNESDGYRWSGC